MALLEEEEDDNSYDRQEVEAGKDHSDRKPPVTDVVSQGHALLEIETLGRWCARGSAISHVGSELGKLHSVV